jgi:superfamily I DNA/RNA helicase
MVTTKPPGPPTFIGECHNSRFEATSIAREIKEKMKVDKSIKFSDFAILYRTKNLGLEIISVLKEFGIPLSDSGDGDEASKRAELEAFAIICQAVLSPTNCIALELAINCMILDEHKLDPQEFKKLRSSKGKEIQRKFKVTSR